MNQSDIFKGMVLLSPVLNIEAVKALAFPENHLCYIYTGKNEEQGSCLKNVYALKELLPNANLVIDDNEVHNELAWKTKVLDALNYLVL